MNSYTFRNTRRIPTRLPSENVGFGAVKKTAPKKVVKAKPVKKSSTKPTIKVTKTKSPATLTPDKNVKSTTIFKMGSASVGGLSTGGSSGSLFDLPAPPPLQVVASNAKTSTKDSLFGIASQIIAGILPNRTVQTSNGQTPIYQADNLVPSNPYAYQQNAYQQNPQVEYIQSDDGAGANVGNSLGQGFDGIIGWAAANPLIVFGGAAALFLLYRQPPSQRR